MWQVLGLLLRRGPRCHRRNGSSRWAEREAERAAERAAALLALVAGQRIARTTTHSACPRTAITLLVQAATQPLVT